jgi:hypothetical protein
MAFTLLLAGSAAASPLRDAAAGSRAGDYEASEAALARVPRDEQGPSYFFYKMVNAHGLNRRAEATKWADVIEADFGQIPRRYRDVAAIIRADLATWKEGENDLGDVSREMRKATDRLKNGMGGPKTREIQKDVEGRLAKMIKKLEDEREAAAKAAQQEAEARKGKREDAQPAQDTHAQQDRGEGRVDAKRLQQLVENWGKLPEKERAKVRAELLRKMSSKDRSVIEAYFEKLAKKGNK